jgi:hypothetical protein
MSHESSRRPKQPQGAIGQVIDGERRLVSPQAALGRARALVAAFDTGEGSPVEELIGERRAGAERE